MFKDVFEKCLFPKNERICKYRVALIQNVPCESRANIAYLNPQILNKSK